MNDTTDEREPAEETGAEEQEATTWQAPDHKVVETSLEVTGYSLNSR
ncbi:pyrroloquinoline quinone precursor peptide PqqA [Streptomyces coeruleoprunus]|uniref:Pyrroloquinoline quinone peptide PqqA n=1 Tax=Streptomyces coeruleoprunus TaxID=285563 RepID=A0ABV9XIG6_9ACTN